ncbi:MAG: hypothetical protein R3Y54_07395 [Eubacteriales bacterium]
MDQKNIRKIWNKKCYIVIMVSVVLDGDVEYYFMEVVLIETD